MARRLSEEEAMDYVAGIAIGQDFAERDWETNESRWLYGKAYDAPIALGKRVRTHTHTPSVLPSQCLHPTHACPFSSWLWLGHFFCAGPVLLRREDVKDIDDLRIETWVNGVLVQVGNTRDMIFSCSQVQSIKLR